MDEIIREWQLHKTKECLTTIINKYYKYIQKVARQYSAGDNFLFDDLVQEGVLGLIKGLKTIEVGKFSSCLAYLKYPIKSAILNFIRTNKNCVSIPYEAKLKKQTEACAAYWNNCRVGEEEILNTTNSCFEDSYRLSCIEEQISKLSFYEQDCFNSFVLDAYDKTKIAEYWNVFPQSMNKTSKRIVRQLVY